MDVRTAACVCGKVRFEARGAPVANAVCHCDDCQAAAHQIEALPHAARILDNYAGTPFAVYRDDRLSCVQGEELLQGHKLSDEAPTTRYLASCCNSAMYLKFGPGWWKSVYRSRFQDTPPPLMLRQQLKHLPAGVERPTDLPVTEGYAARFLARLMLARLAMMVGL